MKNLAKQMSLVSCGLLIIGLASGVALWNMTRRAEIVVGSKNFTESRLLASILAQTIERQTGHSVETRELGSTSLCYDALRNGAIDIYPEYSGTLLTDILKQNPEAEPARAIERAKELLNRQGELTVLEPFGLNDTYVLAVKRSTAESLGVKSLSDLRGHPELKAGFTSEFNQRPDGFRGLAAHYGFAFSAQPVDLAPGHMYGAVSEDHVQIISAFSTDARIQQFDLVLLEDDQHFFPAYQALPLLKRTFVAERPAVIQALAILAGKIDDKTMTALNYSVDIEGIPVKEAARRFVADLFKKEARL